MRRPRPPSRNRIPDDQVICKEIQITGILLAGRRMCHTKKEWDEIHHQSQKDFRDVLGKGAAPSSH